MSYKFLPDVALADIAFEARGRSLNELFEQAALALSDIMADRKKVKKTRKKAVKLTAETVDTLLYDFLSELLYIKDVDSLTFSGCTVNVAEKKGKWELKAVLVGEKIDLKKTHLRNDVKAITMHMFEVSQTKQGWKAVVVVDI